MCLFGFKPMVIVGLSNHGSFLKGSAHIVGKLEMHPCVPFCSGAPLAFLVHPSVHFSTSQKATLAASYFYLFITTGSEERLAVTSSQTISMRYKSCKVNSFSQEFPKIFLS